jgi:hypothetical protein
MERLKHKQPTEEHASLTNTFSVRAPCLTLTLTLSLTLT